MPTTTAKPTTAEQVQEFVAAAKTHGFTWEAKNLGGTGGGVLTVFTHFAPNDSGAYITADSEAHRLVNLAPVVAYGSTWGSDSASVGGHAALVSGNYLLSKSGIGIRFLKALAKVAS